jgi:predicted enzyme related to lactoylglutathione lyase
MVRAMATSKRATRTKPPQPSARRKSRGRPIEVRAVDFVMYCTRDMRRTRKFYQELFGLKRGEEWNDFWSEFQTAPVTLCLNGPSKSDDPKWNWQGTAAVALAVGDIRAAVAECRRRRVQVLQAPVETSVCWMAFIADPEGNRICLHQRKDGTAG